MSPFTAYDPETGTVREYTCESFDEERGLIDLAALAGAALEEARTGGDFWDDPTDRRRASGRTIGSPTRLPGEAQVDTAIMLRSRERKG